MIRAEGRKRLAQLNTALERLLPILIAIPLNIVTGYIPASATAHRLIWIAISAIPVVALLAPRRRPRDSAGSAPPFLPARPGQVVVGAIPREPPAFVARGPTKRLGAAAGSGQVAVLCAVTGMRGVGKTQVAAAYARSRCAAGWGLVAWVNAESKDSLLMGLHDVAQEVEVAGPEGDSAESALRLRKYLENWPGPGLLVFDNARNPDMLRQFLPAVGGAQIVITSADLSFAGMGIEVDVAKFTREESVGYLADATGLNDPAGANVVAQELDDLPLALAQAAFAIRNGRHRSFAAYLSELRRVPLAELLGSGPGSDYTESAAAALLVSVRVAECADRSGLTSLLLRVVAVLSPDGVPRGLLDDLRARRLWRAGRDVVGAIARISFWWPLRAHTPQSGAVSIACADRERGQHPETRRSGVAGKLGYMTVDGLWVVPAQSGLARELVRLLVLRGSEARLAYASEVFEVPPHDEAVVAFGVLGESHGADLVIGHLTTLRQRPRHA